MCWTAPLHTALTGPWRGPSRQVSTISTCIYSWVRLFAVTRLASRLPALPPSSPSDDACPGNSDLLLSSSSAALGVDPTACSAPHLSVPKCNCYVYWCLAYPGTIGTAAYCAPEVLEAGPVTVGEAEAQTMLKSDVYSFGVLLWEILMRRRPWDGMHAFQVLHNPFAAYDLIVLQKLGSCAWSCIPVVQQSARCMTPLVCLHRNGPVQVTSGAWCLF